MKRFVGRNIAGTPPLKRPEVEKKLHNVITKAFEMQTVWSTDWDKLQLDSEPQSSYTYSDPRNVDSDKLYNDQVKVDYKNSSAKKHDKLYTPTPEKFLHSKQSEKSQTKKNTQSSLFNRIEQQSKGQKAQKKRDSSALNSSFVFEDDEKMKARRAKRFESTAPSSSSLDNFNGFSNEISSDGLSWNQGPVVGRSQQLEKRYLRLTSAPDPANVRPLPVLKKTLELLKSKWRSEGNYAYICDQFKSLRQDLTVQQIRNDFTVQAYEIHARIALEKGDLGEYNQCQAQLKALYAMGLDGSPNEFLGYRILYFIYTRNRSGMFVSLLN